MNDLVALALIILATIAVPLTGAALIGFAIEERMGRNRPVSNHYDQEQNR